ncbi:MAG: hypothetical protein JWN03_4978, partial [Nocardia sp.]|nr:hypothetical protein [Nocardia sp.]
METMSDRPFCMWSQLGLNQRPFACEANALPLSYETLRVFGPAFLCWSNEKEH